MNRLEPGGWRPGQLQLRCCWTLPLLAGDDPDLLALAVWRDQPGLPPLVVRGVDDVQDVPVGEAQALAGQAAVPRPVIVEQSSAKSQTQRRAQSLPSCPSP